jgi:hypothetical protein
MPVTIDPSHHSAKTIADFDRGFTLRILDLNRGSIRTGAEAQT